MLARTFARSSPEEAQERCQECMQRHISLCTQLKEGVPAELRSLATMGTFPAHVTIFEQESELDRVYVIIDGMVKLYRDLIDGNRQITGFLGPGDILGGIKRSQGAHCTAETITEVAICVFPRKEFERLMQLHPSLCFMLLFAATDEIEAQNEHLILLGRKRASERLATFLLMMDDRWEHHASGGVVHLPMSRSDIADYLGLTIETVSRVFAKFREESLIYLPEPHVVHLKNLAALYDLSGMEEQPVPRTAFGL